MTFIAEIDPARWKTVENKGRPLKNATAEPTLVWFRHDLRLHDQPALAAAVERGGPIIPVVIYAPEEEAPWAPGSASRWWLHHSLVSLAASLAERGSRLIVRRGPTLATLEQLAAETGARAVVWNRRYEPRVVGRDTVIKSRLRDLGLHAESFNGHLLLEPWEVATRQGGPFQVFTPFWKTCVTQIAAATPLPAPTKLSPPTAWPASLSIDELQLLPTRDWADGFSEVWQPGEPGARIAAKEFLARAVRDYDDARDFPGVQGTSRLSPALHFGEISVRELWSWLANLPSNKGVETYRRELGWREFAHHLLHHFPQTPEQPLRAEFERFPWVKDESAQRAWQRGRTGYPIVDAGMRELWRTGWMHNRVRMIVASFLVKDLRLPWQVGARWFWDTLVDADLANNTLGWQWSAGCGADAAPYFRVFNPILQSRKFDEHGDYLRHWLEELRGFSSATIHAPWESGQKLAAYPAPIVDHAAARDAALAAWKLLRAE